MIAKSRGIFRIFTNDRGTVKGVAMYSALKDVKASSQLEARRKCPPDFDSPHYAPAMAIQWPPRDRDKAWLAEHVGKPS